VIEKRVSPDSVAGRPWSGQEKWRAGRSVLAECGAGAAQKKILSAASEALNHRRATLHIFSRDPSDLHHLRLKLKITRSKNARRIGSMRSLRRQHLV